MNYTKVLGMPLEDYIREILTEDERCRNSDILLYIKMCNRLFGTTDITLIYNRYDIKEDIFASIKRERCRIQRNEPSLRCNDKVRRYRDKRKEYFINKAKEEKNYTNPNQTNLFEETYVDRKYFVIRSKNNNEYLKTFKGIVKFETRDEAERLLTNYSAEGYYIAEEYFRERKENE